VRFFFFFSSRRRHTRFSRDWSSDVCSSDLLVFVGLVPNLVARPMHMALALPWTLVLIARNRVERVTGIILASAGVAILAGLAWQIGRASCRERGWGSAGGGG